MGRFRGSTPDQSFWGRAFLATFASRSLEQSKSPLQISYPGLQWVRKSQKTVRISPQLRRGYGVPGMYMKMALVQKGAEPFVYLMERATGSPRICFANPCFAAGLWPLRAALENAHAFSQLRTLAGSIPVARRVNENSSDPQRKPKPLKQFLWSGRRESNPRHQLGRLGFYH